MIKTILVPLDGSRFGEQALPLATALARKSGAALRIVHKHMPPPPVHPDSVLASDRNLDPHSRRLEQQYLDEVVRRLKADGLVQVSSALIEGPVADALLEHATLVKADLVVMTTHGRGPLQRFWMGSVTDALMRRLPMPVLLVRPSDEPEAEAIDSLPRHVLVPLDGSAHAERILRLALELGRLSSAEFTLLRVVAPVPVLGYDLMGYAAGGTDLPITEDLRREALIYLDKIAASLMAEGFTVYTRAVAESHTASTLLAEARRLGCDMIALETHGLGGLSRLVLGSVADKVVRGASVPVLVHRSAEVAVRSETPFRSSTVELEGGRR